MTCRYAGCGRAVRAKGHCIGHYAQLLKGQPLRPLIPYYTNPEERFWDHVEKGMGCWQWTGQITDGRGRLRHEGRMVLVHRFAYELLVGPIPKGKQIDHRCRNASCVNPDHLRIATNKQNMENLAENGYSTNTSGYRGVFRNGNGWSARVTHNYVNHNLGTFATPEEAAKVAHEARMRLFTRSDGR